MTKGAAPHLLGKNMKVGAYEAAAVGEALNELKRFGILGLQLIIKLSHPQMKEST